jgi:putative ABC transport system ATP-binding protein
MTDSTNATPLAARGAAVRVEDLVKVYRLGDGSILTATDHITLDVQPGTTTAFVGSSGSGKSTLLHLIGAITRADSGTITVGGQLITGMRRRQLADYRATIGFVFQQFHLLPAFTALDNILAPVAGRRVDFDRHERAHELLADVGLAGREAALPSQLSGGQQQRVAIARALINDPRLILADEPTGNLDSTTAAEILQLLQDLQSRRGTTVMLATHDPDLAATCDQTIHIKDGQAS